MKSRRVQSDRLNSQTHGSVGNKYSSGSILIKYTMNMRSRAVSDNGKLSVETLQYAKMVRRVLAAYAKRVADADDVDLAEMLEIRDPFDAVIAQAVLGQRSKFGRSWTEIARGAGISRQVARQRWGRYE
jgi:hypothetical protein